MTEREYNRLRKLIEEEYRQRLEALEVVWALSQRSREAPGTSRSASGGTSVEVVRGIVSELEGEFTAAKVTEAAKQAGYSVGRSTVSVALARLADEKELVRITSGSGRRASVYKKAGGSQPQRTQTATSEKGGEADSTDDSAVEFDDCPL